MKGHTGNILLSEHKILQRVRELGQQISYDYRGKEITIVCVLKGAIVFVADLLRSLEVSTDLDFIQLSSYVNGTESTGEVKFLQSLTTNIENKDVLVVDDILDSGLTLHRLNEFLQAKRPASVRYCVLLDKIKERPVDIKVNYVGFRIPNRFVIGYGLDYAGQYRGLRYITTLEF